MSVLRSPRRCSLSEWGFRGVLAVAAGWVGYLSVTQSLAAALPNSEAERAHHLAPGNSAISADLARRLSGPEATGEDRARADDLARAALLNDPTAVGAVAALGLNALMRDDLASARRIFVYSQHLSRRDLSTQLWAIEDAVSRGDIPQALKYYDIALRTKRSAPEVLYPVLAAAVTDPAIRQGLAETLSKGPPWAQSFIDHAAGNSPDPQATASLLTELTRARVPVSDEASARAIVGLIAKGKLDSAWSFYASVRKDADRRMSRDPRFMAALEVPSVLDWTPASSPGIATSIQRGTDAGVFDFAAQPTVGGPLLRQLQMLPPGNYELVGHSIGIDQPVNSLPYWTLSCREGRELGRVAVRNSTEAQGSFTGHFSVPVDCPVQELALVARPSNQMMGVAGQIDQITLRPSS